MGGINFNDAWARVHLARLCAAFVHADWSSTQEFVDNAGLPFWRMLILLATKYASDTATCTFQALSQDQADVMTEVSVLSGISAASLETLCGLKLL